MSSTTPDGPPEATITAPDDPWAPRSSDRTKDLEPQATTVLNALHDQLRGIFVPKSGWHCFPLSRANYRDLLHHIQHNEPIAVETFFVMKARYDYDAGEEKFVFRASNALHGSFTEAVRDRIRNAIKCTVEEEPSVRQALEPTSVYGCITLQLDVDESVRTARAPDLQIRHDDAYWPTIVVEISFNGKRKDVSTLGYDYLRGSGGRTRVVIFLDVEYAPRGHEILPGFKDAAVTIWRTCRELDKSNGMVYKVPKKVHHELFRDGEGKPRPGALELPVLDFAPPQAFEDLSSPLYRVMWIYIPYADLCADLARAEKAHRKMERFQEDLMSGKIPEGPWETREYHLKRLATERHESPDGADQKRRRIDNENEDKIFS